jgi:hypothetical protein
MEALKLTLQRMGLDPSGLTSASNGSTDTDSLSDNSGTTAESQARGEANKSAGKQFLVALYQALVLQHGLSAPAQQEGDAASTDQVTSAYVDLGSSIEELAKTVRSTSVDPRRAVMIVRTTAPQLLEPSARSITHCNPM